MTEPVPLVQRRPGSKLGRLRGRVVAAPRMALSGLLGLVALGVATAGAVVLAGLADSVLSRGRAVSIDARVHQWVVGHRAAWLTGAMKVLTELGAAPVIAAAVVTTAVVTIAAHRRRDTVLVIAATAGAALATAVIKAAMARARPAGVDQLIHVTGAAFPSGHTAQATACYGAIATIVTRWGRRLATSLAVCTGGAFVALGVGVSRVYLGVHWLSDVVAGWALGATWLAALLAAQAGYQLLCERPMVHWPSCWQGEPGSRAPGPSAGEQGGSR